jgi:hypothetical protein
VYFSTEYPITDIYSVDISCCLSTWFTDLPNWELVGPGITRRRLLRSMAYEMIGVALATAVNIFVNPHGIIQQVCAEKDRRMWNGNKPDSTRDRWLNRSLHPGKSAPPFQRG